MTKDWTIAGLQFPTASFEALAADARSEAFSFIERLVRDWQDGSNRFDGAGECLLGVHVGQELAGVGGLNRDPFSDEPRTGRLRHVYVRPRFRRKGIGRALAEALIARADAFDRLRLRTVSLDAARLYEALGFRSVTDGTATHLLVLGRG